MEKYVEEYFLPCYEADLNMIMTPNAFLDHAQEAANRNAEDLGFGRDELIKDNTAWVLSRIHVIFHRMPKWQDLVRLKTWHKGTRSLFYLRDFTLHDNVGNLLVSATTSWLVLNLETRRISRSRELASRYDECIEENAIEETAPKLVFPKDCEREYVYTHEVRYSDIDVNGHVNNVKYVIWSMDAVGFDVTSAKQVRELKINFNHEAKPGDQVKLYRTLENRISPEGVELSVYTIEGEVDGNISFITELVF